MILAVLLAGLCAQSGAPTIDDLIDRLSADSLEIRDKAQGTILNRWKSWTPADLDKLRKAAESPNAEAAARSRSALQRIELYRTIPDELWKAFPNVGEILHRNEPEQLGKLLQSIEEKWKKGELAVRAVAPIALDLIEDDRDTGIGTGYELRGREDTHTVNSLARNLVEELVPAATGFKRRAEARSWWKENRDKSEKEWHLPALADKDQHVRARAMVRLAALKDPTLHPRLFETLRGLENEYAFEIAAQGLAGVPAEALDPNLKPYLGDRRLSVRLETAKLLLSSMRREAIDAIIEAFEKPEQMEYHPAETGGDLSRVLDWLATTKDDRALGLLYRSVGSGPLELRLQAIDTVSGIDDPRAEEALIRAFDDPEQGSYHSSNWMGDVKISNPRVCDMAAIKISFRLKIEGEFTWPASVRARDRNLGEIRNRWRKARGLAAIPFYGPGVIPVAPERVAELVADLIHEDAGRRKAGIRKLSELGPGAWNPLQEQISKAGRLEKPRLEAAAGAWANALRKVTAVTKEAEPYVEKLRKRMHEVFDLEEFARDVPEAWFDDARHQSMIFRLTRGSDGRGVSLEIEVGKSPGADVAYDSLDVWNGGRGSGLRWDRKFFGEHVRKELGEFEDFMAAGPEYQIAVRFALTKKSKE